MQTFARKAIKILFSEAIKLAKKGYEDEAREAIKQALRTARKYNIRISNLNKQYKKLFCKKCYTVLIPNKTLKVRVHKRRIIYTCLRCGNIMRYPYIKEKKKK